ncbi:hypothetical protein OG311_00120 [Streptomyces sp. NBC_01343]|uniref:hypothetical protein n=1 Tax=Streptomyces sp. NBC_01343 TaxID=2903832 RepID=UPI002E15F9A7|nr:hypothetical protein OG311_00120 [Streptomyces sp. NBC_01343]
MRGRTQGRQHLVLDAVGWYGKDGKALFTPAAARRLADTRTTGKLAPAPPPPSPHCPPARSARP